VVLDDYAASCVEKKPDRYRLEPQRRGRLLPSSASPLSSEESKREKTPDRCTLDTERRGEASLISLPRRFLILHASPPLPAYPQESHKHREAGAPRTVHPRHQIPWFQPLGMG
jgi:hypothetical protein